MQQLVTRCERRHSPASQRQAVSEAQHADAQLSRQASTTTHQTESDPPPFTRLQDAVFLAGSVICSLALFGTCYVLATAVMRGVSA